MEPNDRMVRRTIHVTLEGMPLHSSISTERSYPCVKLHTLSLSHFFLYDTSSGAIFILSVSYSPQQLLKRPSRLSPACFLRLHRQFRHQTINIYHHHTIDITSAPVNSSVMYDSTARLSRKRVGQKAPLLEFTNPPLKSCGAIASSLPVAVQ